MRFWVDVWWDVDGGGIGGDSGGEEAPIEAVGKRCSGVVWTMGL